MAVKPDAEIMYPDIINNAVVHHPVFGVGKVMLRTGVDEKSKVIVKFKEEGEKKLAIRFANLTADKVEEEENPAAAAAAPAAVAPKAPRDGFEDDEDDEAGEEAAEDEEEDEE